MRHLPLLALALSVGCASSRQGRQTQTLSFALGSPRAACAGGEKSVKLDQSIQIERRLGEGGEGCVLDLRWEGALLDAARLGVNLPTDDSATVARIKFTFGKLRLVDEVGQPIELALPELTFRLHFGEAELLALSEKATRGPWGRGRKVELPAAARARVAQHLRQHLPVVGKAHLMLVLDGASRRALQRAAQGPLFELHYEVEVELAPAAKAGAASQPASQPAGAPTSRPAASQPASTPAGVSP